MFVIEVSQIRIQNDNNLNITSLASTTLKHMVSLCKFCIYNPSSIPFYSYNGEKILNITY